jgi:RNA polymerase sigma-70 factor (ECF subfamily)
MRHPSLSIDASSEERPAMTETLADSDHDPSARLERNEKANAVREAVSGLPSNLREALISFEYEDLSYDEIAKIQWCSAKAVETRLYRARGILREKLDRWLRAG